jgi:hypothetical protein
MLDICSTGATTDSNITTMITTNVIITATIINLLEDGVDPVVYSGRLYLERISHIFIFMWYVCYQENK